MMLLGDSTRMMRNVRPLDVPPPGVELTTVIAANPYGTIRRFALGELLPEAFKL